MIAVFKGPYESVDPCSRNASAVHTTSGPMLPATCRLSSHTLLCSGKVPGFGSHPMGCEGLSCAQASRMEFRRSKTCRDHRRMISTHRKEGAVGNCAGNSLRPVIRTGPSRGRRVRHMGSLAIQIVIREPQPKQGIASRPARPLGEAATSSIVCGSDVRKSVKQVTPCKPTTGGRTSRSQSQTQRYRLAYC